MDTSESKNIYRVDKFIIPASSRDEFLARTKAVQGFLKTQDGFIRSACLEQFSGPGEFNIVTIAQWSSSAHVERAKAAVAAFAQEAKFEPQEEFQRRLGIKADLGFYKETVA